MGLSIPTSMVILNITIHYIFNFWLVIVVDKKTGYFLSTRIAKRDLIMYLSYYRQIQAFKNSKSNKSSDIIF